MKHSDQNGACENRGKYSNLLLQLFVGIIDTELLKGVLDGAKSKISATYRIWRLVRFPNLFEMLKTVDIQNTDEHLRPARPFTVFASQTLVDDSHKPFKKTSVDEPCHRIPDAGCLRSIQRGDDLLVTSGDLFLNRPFFEVCQGDSEEASCHLECRIDVIDRSFVTHRNDLDVSKVQEGREKFENGPLFFHTDTNGRKGVLGLPELFSVVDAIDRGRSRTALFKVVEFSDVGIEAQVLSFF